MEYNRKYIIVINDMCHCRSDKIHRKGKCRIEVIYFSKICCKTNYSPIGRSQSQSTIKASLAGLLKELWFHLFKKCYTNGQQKKVSSLKLPRSWSPIYIYISYDPKAHYRFYLDIRAVHLDRLLSDAIIAH